MFTGQEQSSTPFIASEHNFKVRRLYWKKKCLKMKFFGNNISIRRRLPTTETYKVRTKWFYPRRLFAVLFMGVGWGRLGGSSLTPVKGPQFEIKYRRMVFLSVLLPRLLRKISYGANANMNVYGPNVARKIVRFFNVLPLCDDFLGFLCIHDHIWSSSAKGPKDPDHFSMESCPRVA